MSTVSTEAAVQGLRCFLVFLCDRGRQQYLTVVPASNRKQNLPMFFHKLHHHIMRPPSQRMYASEKRIFRSYSYVGAELIVPFSIHFSTICFLYLGGGSYSCSTFLLRPRFHLGSSFVVLTVAKLFFHLLLSTNTKTCKFNVLWFWIDFFEIFLRLMVSVWFYYF